MSSNQDYGIYLVTDPVLCGPRGVVETVRLAVDGGVHTVQLRDKHASFDQQLSQLEQLAVVIDGRAKLGRVSYMRNQTRIAASTTPARYVTASLS